MNKLAQLADSQRVDWLGLALAIAALVAYKLGVDIDAFDVLVTQVGAALGRGALITQKRKAQQSALIDLAESASGFVTQLKPEPLAAAPEPADTEADTAPIDVEERHG